MKTLCFIKSKIAFVVLSLTLGVLMVSCGSYTNSSYYDNDGIYSGRSNTAQRTELPEVKETQPVQSSYFSQFQDIDYMQDNGEPIGIFTDVDTYYGDGSYSSGYAGWGNQTSDVTVNIYGGPYWGWNGWYGSYWGWRPYWGWSSWYYPSYYLSWNWGFGWGYYGWGYPYYYGYYPYYGYHYYNVVYNNGPRSYGTRSDYRGNTRNVMNTRRGAYEVRGREVQTNSTRNNQLNTTRSSRFDNRNLNTGTRNSTINTNRGNNSNTRGTINTGRNTNINQNNRGIINNNRNSDSNRTRNINSGSGSSRNSSYGSGSFGSGRSSGGSSGGGRSSGGGGRR